MPKATECNTAQIAGFFRVLSDRTRLAILWLLKSAGESHVSSLCDQIGILQPLLSHHLRILRDAHMVAMRREGKHNYYHLTIDQLTPQLRQVAKTMLGLDENLDFRGTKASSVTVE